MDQESLINTNMGKIPFGDYCDIVAMQHGFDDYCDMKNQGFYIDINRVEYPKLTKQEKDVAGREAVGHPYPTEWIEILFAKYRDWDYVKNLLITKSKEEIYNLIRGI